MLHLALLILPLLAAPSVSPQALVDRATRAFEAGDFTAALETFRQVEPAMVRAGDSAVFRWNIARCLEELGRPDEALTAFEDYLALPDSPDNQADARVRMGAIRERFLGTVEVTCAPAHMRFDIEGTQAPSRACPVQLADLRAGRCVLVGSTPDGRETRQTIEVRAGVTQAVTLALPGTVRVTAQVEGEAFVDGAPLGRVPAVSAPVAPGTHAVRVRAPGYVDWSTTVQVGAGAQVAVQARPLPLEAPVPRWAVWTSGGAAVAALTAGAVFFAATQDAFDDAATAQARYDRATNAEDAALAREDAQAEREDGRSARVLTYGLWGAGLGLAGLTTWLFLRSQATPTAEAAAGQAVWGVTF